MSGWGCQWSREDSRLGLRNLGGQQLIYVVQVKPLLGDKRLAVVDFLFLRLEVGISHRTGVMASMGRREILCGLISDLLVARVRGFSL